MPGCVVFGCTSGYNPTHKRGPEEKKYQLFIFPKEKRIKNLWVARINRQGWQPTDGSQVCAKHFLPEDFQYVPGDLDKAGRERKKYCLKDNALPSLYMKGAEPESGPSRKVLRMASKADVCTVQPSLCSKTRSN